MGMYDYLKLDSSIQLPGLPDSVPVEDLIFQTKEFQCLMRTYQVNSEGQLVEEEFHTEEVPREERPKYNEEIDGFENDIEEMFGSMKHVTDGWHDKNYHGRMRIIQSGKRVDELPDSTVLEYILKFTDGKLQSIKKADGWKLGDSGDV